MRTHRISEDVEEKLYNWASRNMMASTMAGKTFNEVLEELLNTIEA